MKTYNDVDLVELADWAERNEREAIDPDLKKSYGAIRQGSDWLLRYRTKMRQREIENAGNTVKVTSTPTKQ